MSLGLLVVTLISGLALALALAEWSVKRYCRRTRPESQVSAGEKAKHAGGRISAAACPDPKTRSSGEDNR